MEDFGKRLRGLIQGSRFKSIQAFADAAGFDRSTIHVWMDGRKGEAKKPKRASIEKLAELLGCNPDWLDTGEGDAWAVQRKTSNANIPSAQRLDWLKGRARVEDFAKKCGISPVRMAQYLDGARMTDDDVYAVAKACGCSLGWLTSGEPWQGPDKMFTGFSLEWHRETGERLYKISRYMHKLQTDLHFSYPLTGNLSKAAKVAAQCVNDVEELRSTLENNHLNDSGSSFSTKTYYCAERIREIEKISTLLDKLFNEIKLWRAEVDDGNELMTTEFIELFRERFKEFDSWYRSKTIIKNPEERWANSVDV